MLKISRSVFLFLIVLSLSTVLACGNSSPAGPRGKTTSATVSVDVQVPSQAQSKASQNLLGTVNDITSLTVDVLKEGAPLITGQPLTYSDGFWSGTLENLPIGPSLTFVGHAYDVSAVEIFTGTTVQALTGTNDSITILMAPVDDGVPATFPRITRIMVPSQIVTSSTVTIVVWVEGSSGETLTYATTAAAGGGSFNPSSGTITLGGTTGTLVLSYSAPSTAGTYTHSIRVTNSQTNWVETNFATISVVNPSSELVVIEERNTGDLLIVDPSYTGADTRWTVLYDNLLNQFYETHAEQNYDFIVLFPTKPMVSHWATTLNRYIDGIGGGYGTYPYAPNLNALIGFDLFPLWTIGYPAPDSTLLNGVLIHEIGHYWLADIQWPQHVAIGHWQNNLDLFGGDTRYVDPMAYYHWIIKNGQEACVNGNAPNVTRKFSNLSLYIMGLLPPGQVSPIYEHRYDLQPGNDHYNMWGPACGDTHQFIETRTITIQDIINANGARNPSYEQSKKDFRTAFIIVTAKGEAVPTGFIDYVRKYRDALPGAWSQITSGKSSMVVD